MHHLCRRQPLPSNVIACAPKFVMIALIAIGFLATLNRSATAEPPQPAKKDSRPQFKPKNAVLTTSVEPGEAKAGQLVAFKVTAKLDPGAHIYKYSKGPGGGGPVNTSFDFFDPAGLKIEGDWTPSQEPEKHKDPNFAEVDFVEYHEDEVTWSVKLKIPEDTEPGKKVLRCQAGYMVCDEKRCSVPGQWTLPDAELTVGPGGAKGPDASVAAKPGAPTPPAATAKPPAEESKPAAAPVVATTPSAAITEPSSTAAGQSVAAKSAVAAQPAAPEEAAARVAPKTATAPAFATTAPSATATEPASTAVVQSEIAQKAQQGLIPFLFASALGGLFALVMPCVWPMVPITVNFFVKQGQGKGGRAKATQLAIIYCLSIIGVFTAVGVLFSFFVSASALQTLANNPWLNLVVAGLFIAFGLSLLGMFELRLPNFLLNASAQGESRGGLVGVMFMALTLTITSFTCTFPVVGGLLVMAAGGNFFYPIVGLATFATVIALPFFMLALSPNLISKMPRSGDWMNAVKVVGGLVEIGAALKFVNTAELAWVSSENAWFDVQVVLTAWVVLSAVCGIYLLGIFRTDHDQDEVKVGPGRLVFGAMFLGLALYMAPALFGRPPVGLVWDRLIVGILPPDADELTAEVQVAGNGSGVSSGSALTPIKATSNDPAQAERQEKKAHGVLWGLSLEQARELAATEKKPILIDFTGVNCANCRLMERRVLRRPEVVDLLKKFVTVELYTDFVDISSLTAEQRRERAEVNQDRILNLVNETTNPFYVVLTPGGEVVGKIGGYNDPAVFVDFLTKALEKLGQETKMAEAGSSPAQIRD